MIGPIVKFTDLVALRAMRDKLNRYMEEGNQGEHDYGHSFNIELFLTLGNARHVGGMTYEAPAKSPEAYCYSADLDYDSKHPPIPNFLGSIDAVNKLIELYYVGYSNLDTRHHIWLEAVEFWSCEDQTDERKRGDGLYGLQLYLLKTFLDWWITQETRHQQAEASRNRRK